MGYAAEKIRNIALLGHGGGRAHAARQLLLALRAAGVEQRAVPADGLLPVGGCHEDEQPLQFGQISLFAHIGSLSGKRNGFCSIIII